MDWFHFTSKCFIGDVKEHSNDTLLKWLLFSAGPHQIGESIIIDLASGEILHSSYKYGQKYIVLESVFFSSVLHQNAKPSKTINSLTVTATSEAPIST